METMRPRSFPRREKEVQSELLPEDIVIEILARLQVRSLMRLRCVSKSWFAVIKSPSFIRRHLEQQENGRVLLLRRCSRVPGKYDMFSFHDPDSPNLEKLYTNLHIPFLKDITHFFRGKRLSYVREIVNVLGPCNGLICIAHTDYFILCNPALREFKKLPPCPYEQPYGYHEMYAGHGFGVTRTGDYKVVLLRPVKVPKPSCCVVYVCNLRTNSWKKIDYDPTVLAKKFYEPCSHVFFNGVCHWNADFQFYWELNFVLCFDINTEVIKRMEYPDFPESSFEFEMGLMILNDCLAMTRRPSGSYGGGMEIWVRKEYGVKESWSKQLVISELVMRPLLPWKNDEWLLMERGDRLTAYASSPTRMKGFKLYGAKNTFRGLIYQESLISVNQVTNHLI